MKTLAPMLVLATLCACARPDAGTPATTTSADATPPAASTDAPSGAPAPSADTSASSAPASPAPQASTPPDAPGIAVGEPHPSGNVPIDPGPARYDGYGDLRFGMTGAAARKAWKGALQGDEVKPDNCAYLRPAGTAAGPFLMFEGGTFVRYDVQTTNTTAPGGGRVGMAADDIRRLYAGRVEEQPHHYVPGGKYLRIADPASKDRALLFEVDEHGRVTTWRVGRAPQVDYVEGCA